MVEKSFLHYIVLWRLIEKLRWVGERMRTNWIQFWQSFEALVSESVNTQTLKCEMFYQHVNYWMLFHYRSSYLLGSLICNFQFSISYCIPHCAQSKFEFPLITPSIAHARHMSRETSCRVVIINSLNDSAIMLWINQQLFFHITRLAFHRHSALLTDCCFISIIDPLHRMTHRKNPSLSTALYWFWFVSCPWGVENKERRKII